jgi:hypothetical protein
MGAGGDWGMSGGYTLGYMDGVLFWCFGVGWVAVLDSARRRVSHV